MPADLNILTANLNEAFAGKIVSLENKLEELTLVIAAADMVSVLTRLRDDADLGFEQLTDLCVALPLPAAKRQKVGASWRMKSRRQVSCKRFAVSFINFCLSRTTHVFAFAYSGANGAADAGLSFGKSPLANWYEREAFDLYGIIFVSACDYRRPPHRLWLCGNPFRKDFHCRAVSMHAL